MLKKSCQWWLIWYLLYICHGAEDVPDKDTEIDTAVIAVPIVFIMGGVIGIMACCVYRIKKKRKKPTDEADSLSKEGNNFLRLYLCQKIATQAVRVFFDSQEPVNTLESFLNEHKSKLTDKKNHYKCTKEQEAKLFPVGHVVVASTNFDFTLLYKLIRNCLTTIPAPACGWGNQPSHAHLNETDDIERIRHFRNFLAHDSKFEICDADFSTRWTEVSQAIGRLSKGTLSTDVESMRTKKFDKCKKNEMEEDMRKGLKELREELMELRQDMTECKTDIAKRIPSNIRKGHVKSIEKWRIEDELFYYETGGVTAALKMVKSKNYMTIIGGPGSGKTATARHIALQLAKQGWEVVPVCKLEQIIQFGDRDYRQVFVRDDVLGIFAVDNNFYNCIRDLEEPIFNAIGGKSKLLFTSRKSVYNEVSKLGLFVTENLVDLESTDNQLTEIEKMKICQHHCKSKDLSPDLYASLSFTNANHMFPFLCQIFSRNEKYQQLGEKFFNKPFEYFDKELGTLKETNTIQYAVLVLCLVNEGKLSVEHLPPEDMQKKVFNNCRVNLGTSDAHIKAAIYNQSETYFTKLETEYTFRHDFIFEAIAYHYGCQNKHQILTYLSSSYIAKKVIVYDPAANEDLCIHISKEMYLPLAERLYRDIQSMNLFDVFTNKSLKHRPFLHVFETMLKTKPFGEFESLILRKRQNIDHFVHTTFSGNRILQQMIDDIEYDRLNLLFDRVFHTKSDTECNVKVINWIINYGHTHLLQEIVNHVEYNKYNISLVFGSNIMENGRMLSLGCYSNNLDMVELILKWVDLKFIDTDLTSTCTSEKIGINVNTQVTPLGVACSVGNLDIVKKLLRSHVAINKCSKWNESPLFIASKHGHMNVVECLLNSGADINLRDHFENSPLFVASEKGYCDIVKCLYSSGAHINSCGIWGHSPLFVASEKGHCDVVKCLLSYGANIKFLNILKQSPLFVASRNGHCDVVKYLIKFGVDVNFRSILEQSPLFVASEKGHCDVVECLLNSDANTNLCSNLGLSPLFVASKEGHCGVVKCLLNYRADIKFCDNIGQSSLFVASKEGHCGVVKCLLSSGADINLSDKYGQSPLFVASQQGHCDVVKCLLIVDADIKFCDNIGQSSLFVTSKEGHCGVVKCLPNYGADINLCDKYGQSPLFVASQQGHCDVVKCLLSSGADINLRDNIGQSSLFVASEEGQCGVVKCLLCSGADINLSDKYGQSPLFVASQKGLFDVVKCLLSTGAYINLCDEDRQSPLFVASNLGHCDVVKCLLKSGADINLCNERGQLPAIWNALSYSWYYDIVAHGALRDEDDSNA